MQDFEGRISRLEADTESGKKSDDDIWRALDSVRKELGEIKIEMARTNTILASSHNITLWIAGVIGAAFSQIAAYAVQHWGAR